MYCVSISDVGAGSTAIVRRNSIILKLKEKFAGSWGVPVKGGLHEWFYTGFIFCIEYMSRIGS
jgi:hypothetical protein